METKKQSYNTGYGYKKTQHGYADEIYLKYILLYTDVNNIKLAPSILSWELHFLFGTPPKVLH